MRDLARVAAFAVAVLVVLRDVAIGGGAAMRTPTVLCALFVLVALTFWRDGFVTASGAALTAHYVVALVFGDVAADFGVPLTAALVVAYLDLADLGMSLPRDRRVDRAFLLDRLRHLGRVSGIAGAAAGGVVLVTALPWPTTGALRALAVAGVLAVVAAPYLLWRSQ